jgi:hypothetical protein
MPKRKKKTEEPVVFGRGEDREECVVNILGGKQLCCPAYPAPCDYIRVLSDDGEEIGYWHHDEFTADAQEVMGALMGCLKRGEED